jgi:hypothetical protein
MTPWQIALSFLILGVLIADIILTQRMLVASKRALDATRALMRHMGYTEPPDDEYQ